MNKKLIALALAGACVAPTAMAQTANPVTLYGRVYLTLESVKADPGIPNRMRIEDQASLLGVRGTEDLGGGTKVFWQLETAFRADQAGTAFATRNSGIGLQGRWGSVLFGRWDMPMKVSSFPVDFFGDLTIGGIVGVGHDQGNFDTRANNVVQYWSPNFGGFAFRVAGTANEGKTAALNPRDMGANVTFTRGPLYLFAAWEEHKDRSATLRKEEGISVGGAFSIGPVKLGLIYEEYDKGSREHDNWLANVVYSLGKNRFVYQFQTGKDRAAAGAECDSHSVGYQYDFTKRTFFLAQYTAVENDRGATCNFGFSALPISANADPEGFSVGLRHLF